MKKFNEEYFYSLKPFAKKRYAMFLFESPGYGACVFRDFERAIKAQDNDKLADLYDAMPEEAAWFDKHLQNDPEALEVQKKLFDLNPKEEK